MSFLKKAADLYNTGAAGTLKDQIRQKGMWVEAEDGRLIAKMLTDFRDSVGEDELSRPERGLIERFLKRAEELA